MGVLFFSFSNSIVGYIRGIGEVTSADRGLVITTLDPFLPNEHPQNPSGNNGSRSGRVARRWKLPQCGSILWRTIPLRSSLNDKSSAMGSLLVWLRYGFVCHQPHRPDPLLLQEFITAIDKCVEELQDKFKDGLEGKCRTGAELVSLARISSYVTLFL